MNTKIRTIKERTEFEYNALGQVVRTHNSESNTYCTYYTQSSSGSDKNSNSVPDLSKLLAKFKMADDSSLANALKLSCPSAPDANQPPLLGLLQISLAPDGTALHTKLTLFGYHLSLTDAKGVLIPNTMLTLENITVDTSSSPWTVNKIEDSEGLRITLQQNTRSTDNTGSQQTVTNWYKTNSTRVTHTLYETFKHNTASQTHLTCRTTKLVEDGQELEPVLSQQVRSALSGALLCESRQDELGRPVSQIHNVYDVRGRRTGSYLADYDQPTFTSGAIRSIGRQAIHREETGNGTWITVTGPDGRCGRTLYDGLQRAVRHELQRYPGADHSLHNYCLIHEVKYDGCGNIAEQYLYDYLPGGLRRRQRDMQMPAKMNDWFWQGELTTASINVAGNTTQVTEHTLGSIKGERRTTVQQTLTNHTDGHLTERLQRWSNGETDQKNQGIQIDKELDGLGRLVQRSETIANADGSRPAVPTRLWKMEYDTLNRKTRQHCPDGMVIEFDYQGYATSPVKVTVRKGKDVRVLGSRTLKGDGLKAEQVLTLTRGDLPNDGALTYGYQATSTALPDQSKIVKELSANGETVDYFVERPSTEGKAASKTLLVSFKRNQISQVLLKERHKTGEHQSYQSEVSISPTLLGTLSISQQSRGNSHEHTQQQSLRGEVEQVRHASGVNSRAWRNANGLVTRIQRDGLEYLYDYTALGEVRQVNVKGADAASDLKMDCSYDANGLEVSREYHLEGKPVVRYEWQRSPAGQLLNKKVYREGAVTPSSTQNFKYDTLTGRLTHWSIDALESDQVRDSDGNVLIAQSYTYDLIANITQCKTTRADGSIEVRDYAYHASYSTRRESVTITQLDTTRKEVSRTTRQLNYDGNGNLSVNERGQTLTYTPTGRLASVSDATCLLTTYEYDAEDRLITQWDNVAKQRILLAYSGDHLCMETWLDEEGSVVKQRVLDEQAGLIVKVNEISESGSTSKLLINMPDPHGGGGDQFAMTNSGRWERESIAFSPWGQGSVQQLGKLEGIGFAGQRVDPITGCYHLGNGYRSYDPREMCFQQPDDWSPFGMGGLNDRAYCAGDPVNSHDPSGHMMVSRLGAASQLASLDEMIRDTAPPVHERPAWWEWALVGVFYVIGAAVAVLTGGAMMVFLLTLLLISTALDLASLATRHTNPKLSQKLGYAALAVGLADLAVAGLKKIGLGLLWGMRQAKRLKDAIKFKSITNVLRKSQGYVKHFDSLEDIGSSASKMRSTSRGGILKHTFDLTSDAAYIDDVIENSMGITTWGGKQMGFTALAPNRANTGGVYAMVDLYDVGNTVARNADEVIELGKEASEFKSVLKNNANAVANAVSMTTEAALLKLTNKALRTQHKVVKDLQKVHEKAFEEVTRLKGVHGELAGMRTHPDFHMRPNTHEQSLGRFKISEVPDIDLLTKTARRSTKAEIYEELMNSIESADEIFISFSTAEQRMKEISELTKTLHPDNYQIIHPVTGERSTVPQLMDRYFRTTLNQTAEKALGGLKKEMLFRLAREVGDEEGVKNLWKIASAQTDAVIRDAAYREVLRELMNSVSAKHTTAISRLERANLQLGAQSRKLHKLLDQQNEAFHRFNQSRADWLKEAIGMPMPKSIQKMVRSPASLSTPRLRLDVFGHLDELGLTATANIPTFRGARAYQASYDVAAPRYGLRVSNVQDRTEAALQGLRNQPFTDSEMQEATNLLTKNFPTTTEWWGPEKLQQALIQKGLDPAYFDDVRLVMCNSATGGEASFANKFSILTGSNVKAFEGSVTSTGFIERTSSWTHAGFVEHMGAQNNPGFFARLEGHYESALNPNISLTREGLANVAGEAGTKASAIYVALAKHNTAYNTYKPRTFSPLLGMFAN